MRWIIGTVGALYIVGAMGIFAMHTQMPVTFGLAVLRSVLWPVWVTTGRPHGEPTWRDYDGPDAG